MTSIPSEPPSHHVAALAMLINDHIDRIAKERGEFKTIGKLIREIFAKSHFIRGELSCRIPLVMRKVDLSESTKVSMRITLTAIARIHDAPEEWIQQPFYDFHQKMIIERVNRRADQLISLPNEVHQRELSDREAAQQLAEANQLFLRSAASKKLSKLSALLGSVTRHLTLDEVQQREEEHFFYFIEGHGLEEFRDTSLPLNEDTRLIRHLARDKEQWYLFNALPNLFKSSKPAAIVLISEGVMTLAHFDRSLQSDKDVILAGALQGRYSHCNAEDVVSPLPQSPRAPLARSSPSQQPIYNGCRSPRKGEPSVNAPPRRALGSVNNEPRSNRINEVRARCPKGFWAQCRIILDREG